MATDLTDCAALGYAATEGKSPFLFSSPCDIAWKAGYWLNQSGRSAPRNVRMSRGLSIRANDMLLRWLDDLPGIQFERLT